MFDIYIQHDTFYSVALVEEDFTRVYVSCVQCTCYLLENLFAKYLASHIIITNFHLTIKLISPNINTQGERPLDPQWFSKWLGTSA